MKRTTLGLLLACGMMLPSSSATAGNLGPAPEGSILISACLPDQGRDEYGRCTETGPSSIIPSPPDPKTVPTELFALNRTGGRQVTDNEMYESSSAVWSPSRKQFAIRGGPYDDYEECVAYVIDAQDGSATQITPRQELACPTPTDWSKDGKWILLSVYFHDGPTQLYKVKPDGSGLTELSCFNDEGQAIYDAWFIDDGRSIIYWGSPGYRSDVIGVMRSDGGQVRTLAKFRSSGEDRRYLGSVALSPNHRKVAYILHDGDDKVPNPDEAFVMSTDGTLRQRMTFNEIDETSISWGPGSRRLAIVQGSSYSDRPRTSIKVLDTYNGGSIVIKSPAKAQIDRWDGPVWSPSGSFIAFEVATPDGATAIYTANIRSGHLKQITEFGRPMHLRGWSI